MPEQNTTEIFTYRILRPSTGTKRKPKRLWWEPWRSAPSAPVWCVLPVRRPVGCHWAIHTCVDSLEIEKARVAAAEMARQEWVEKMKRSRRR